MRLPAYQPNQVQTVGASGVRVPTDVSAEAFGAGVGRALSQAGNVAAHIAIREQARADDSAVTQARSAVSRWDDQNVSAYQEMAGKTAMDRAGPLESERETYQAEVRKSLNPRQQRIFDQEMAPSNNAFFHNLSRTHARATNEYHDATYRDSGDAFLESVGKAAANEVEVKVGAGGSGASAVLDTGTVKQKIADRLAQIDVYYALDGNRFDNPEAAKRADMTAAVTGAHAVVLDGLIAKGRDTDAAAYFERFQKEMRPEVRNEFQAKVLASQQAGTVTRAVGEAWLVSGLADPTAFDPPVAGVERKTVSERQAEGLARIDGAVEDPTSKRRAKAQFVANVKAQASAADQQRKALGAELDAEIAAGAAWDEIAADPRYGKLEPAQQNARATLWKARMEGRYAVTAPALVDEITTEMVRAPDAFLNRDLDTMAAEQRISESDKNEWKSIQDRLVKARVGGGAAKGGYAGVLSVEDQINAAAAALYEDDTDENKRLRGEYKIKASAALRAQFSEPGAKPDYESTKVVLDALNSEAVYNKSTFLGIDWLSGDDSQRLVDVLTEAEIAEMSAAMRRAGIPVTVPNMLEMVKRQNLARPSGD